MTLGLKYAKISNLKDERVPLRDLSYICLFLNRHWFKLGQKERSSPEPFGEEDSKKLWYFHIAI